MGTFNVLGICDGHGASAAIVVDGEVVAAAAEERFTRRKNTCGYPRLAVRECLELSGLSPRHMTLIVLAGTTCHPLWAALRREEMFGVDQYLREQECYWSKLPLTDEGAFVSLLEEYVQHVRYEDDREDLEPVLKRWNGLSFSQAIHEFSLYRRQFVVEELDIEIERVLLADHHRCHAAYGYFSGRYRGPGTIVLTMDASGDGVNATINLGTEDGLVENLRTRHCDLGRLYRAVTLELGLRPEEDEYKIMGLAPYAPLREVTRALARIGSILQQTRDGDFMYVHAPIPFEQLFHKLQHLLSGLRFDGIAGAVQTYAEQLVERWARSALERYEASHLIFSGGVALNVKINTILSRLEALRSFYVPPGPGDESLSIGAAYIGIEQIRTHLGLGLSPLCKPLDHAYLGSDITYGTEQTELSLLVADGFNVQKVNPEIVARDIADGCVIGRCAGRMEFGPRALGNRSIFVDPVDPLNVTKLNRRVKSRDFWMPFAPITLNENAQKYFDIPMGADLRFMTVACPVTPVGQRECPAAIHPYDSTARPLCFDPEVNPDLASILAAFEVRTGRAVLLNTSLNLHGDPIVRTASEAAALLRGGHLDGLILGGSYIKSPAQRD